MDWSKITEQFKLEVDNMTPEKQRELNDIYNEDDLLYELPNGLVLDLPNSLLGTNNFVELKTLKTINILLRQTSFDVEVKYHTSSKLTEKNSKEFNVNNTWRIGA